MAARAPAPRRSAIGRASWLALYGLFCLVVLLYALVPRVAQGSPDDDARAPRLEVEILSPEDGATVGEPVLKVQVVVRTAAGTTVRLHPLVDGQPVATSARGLQLHTEPPARGAAAPITREFLQVLEIPIPRANCTVAVTAETAAASRTSAAVRLSWHASSNFVLKPKLYVLAVGISAYREGDLTLRYAGKDATDFARAFQAQEGGLYERVQVRTLVDQQATRDNILDGLQWLQRQTTSNDVAILFLAGHGIDDPSSGVYYFLPHDADSTSTMRTMISQQSIQTVLRSITGKALLFLDTCHAASVMNGAAGRAVSDISRLVQELANVDNGLVVYAAASSRQLSQESARWGNGVFTKAVVEGVLGAAAYHAGRPITAQMLNLYVSERVKELTAGVQTPIMVTTQKMADFPLALRPDRPVASESSQTSASLRPALAPRLLFVPPTPPPVTPLPLVTTAQVATDPALTADHSGASEHTGRSAAPVYKKAWFWLTLGGAAVVVGGLVAYAAVSSGAASTPTPIGPGGTTLTFTKVE